jgi:acyl-CoA hydrolase
MWDSIENSEDWVNKQIPDFIKFLYENDFEQVAKDVNYYSKIDNVEFSLISTSYMFSLAAGIMALGFKYIGSNNKSAAKVIVEFINKMRNVKAVQDIIIKDNLKYFNNNKFFVNKTTLDQCLSISAYALSMVKQLFCNDFLILFNLLILNFINII